ncbi:protein possibly involved in post-translational modification of quorum-sensing peptides [Halobacteroides halobius DSM 5150]|uniref:Protein possibly involved in post-translational modification of quorum-sensing peptides n=1 Tax=Halobacteroides halobius (strain ATCC 35273 / DSM 5150 / MD-1) TaxID=748449 RepID=L0KBT4_HALHC|nr:accessory gene regulator B family protein [Halobacteroides halobius]AGB42471.1 protein possibly involved in post-translational modification of quorum-sensing peptides [Halobacteroides halobius DSM 5150]
MVQQQDKFDLISNKIIDTYYQESSPEEKEILVFGTKIILVTVIGYSLILLFGSLLGVGYLALIAAVTAGVIKIFSGGVHASSLIQCVTSGTIMFNLFGLAAKYSTFYLKGKIIILLFGTLLIGSVIIDIYAPAIVKEKPINSKSKASRYKIYSFISFFIVHLIYFSCYKLGVANQFVVAGLLGVIWQLFSLTPLSYRLYNRDYITVEQAIEGR